MKIEDIIKRLFRFLRLTHDKESNEVIQETIESGIVFKGANLWILMFAILVASVGLNMNSTAIIIGAMLISPLIGPITGIGYSVATYNFPLLRRSLKNIGFAVGMSLLASTLYFLITPIHTEHSELLTRTSPTIYDVLIGLFGGLAGIVAISSKNKGNVIPGVAIATALMPPLCTAGYGIAIGNWGYFLGAMYLFVINSVYIALAAMIVSQMLRLPRKTRVLQREIKNKNIAVITVIIITVVPSIYLGYQFVQKEEFVVRANKFVKKVSRWEGDYLLNNAINADKKEITLVYSSIAIDSAGRARLNDKADDFGLADATLTIEQASSLDEYQGIIASGDQQSKNNAENIRLRSTLISQEKSIDSLKNVSGMGESLLKEINPFFPKIESCAFAFSKQYVDSKEKPKSVAIVYFTTSEPVTDEEVGKIHEWLKNRLKTNQKEPPCFSTPVRWSVFQIGSSILLSSESALIK